MKPYPNLKQRLADLIANESTADVTFLVGGNKVPVKAHSQLLSTASEAFTKMLYGDFSCERTIQIPDGTPEGFRALLSYVYTDEACLTLENVSSALYLSNKYFVTGLYNECLVFLKQNLSAENVCDFLGTAELFEELPEVCDDVIRNRAEELLKSDSFLRLSKDLMARVIARDELQVRELTVYERSVEWAKHQLQREGRNINPSIIREALGDSIYLIRFPLMDIKDFAAGPVVSGLLTDKETINLYAWFVLSETPDKFSCLPRASIASDAEYLIKLLGLQQYNTCRHVDEVKCMSVESLLDARRCMKTCCDDVAALEMWICLDCLQTACGYKDNMCGIREHSAKEHHGLFILQNFNDIWCGACWLPIALKS